MSVHLDQAGWIVRWRDGSGRQRGRRFPSEEAARGFDDHSENPHVRDRRLHGDGADEVGGD